MKQIRHILLTTLIIITYTSIAKAQSINDEFKMKLRESLIAPPEKPPALNSKVPKIELQQEKAVLKVSPTTKLPTKFDRIIINPMPEIKLNLNVTNSTPFNVRPTGSTEYVFDRGKMQIRSNAGQAVVPSGMNFGSSDKNEKQQQRVRQLMKAYRND